MKGSGGNHFGIEDLTEPGEQPNQLAQYLPQVFEDHADVVAAAAEHGEERIP